MFLEVFSEQDRDVLLQQGYKLIKEVQLSSAVKYVFANRNDLQFGNLKIKANVTNTLTF